MSTKEESQESDKEVVQAQIRKIWKRARSNAFAHRAAANEYKSKATAYFTWQVIFGMAASMFVLFAYIVSTTETQFVELYWCLCSDVSLKLSSLTFTILSVFFSTISLFLSIMQNYKGYEQLGMNHNHNHHSFLWIAQRAREVLWPGVDGEKAKTILEDIERDFQVIKVRGREPDDAHFDIGHFIINKIDKSKARDMQSFPDELITGNIEVTVEDRRDDESSKLKRLLVSIWGSLVSWFKQRGVKMWLIAVFMFFVASVLIYCDAMQIAELGKDSALIENS